MDGITITNGTPEIAYVGAKPWHGMGNEVRSGGTIDQWKIDAGMTWSIERGPVTRRTDSTSPYSASTIG